MYQRLIGFMFAAMVLIGLVHAGDMAMNHDMHGMDAKVGGWNSRDEAGFLFGMIEHHIGAVHMAEAVAESASDRAVRDWAKNIIADQNREIELMRSLIAERGYTDHGAGDAMRDAMKMMMDHPYATDADVNFVAMMIPHHAGAIEMSVPALVGTTDKRVRKLAEDIIKAQTKEIAEFRDWLDMHGGAMAM